MSRSLLTRSFSSVSLYEVGSQHQDLAVAHKLAGNNVARSSTHNGRLNHTDFDVVF